MTGFRATRIFESPIDGAYFFGYFSTPQVSACGTRLLALRVARFDRLPEPGDVAEVGWFDLVAGDKAFHVIGKTTAFNWQQGAMLQFLGPEFRSRVIWNYFNGVAYRACVHDLENGQRQDVPAIYCTFPDGYTALTVDYERHAWCRRGYSYGNVMRPEKNLPVVPGDAISKVNLKTGVSAPIVMLDDMMRLKPHSNMRGAIHYLEHATVNPTGTRFVFLHRWRHENGIHSRLCVANADGSNVRILNDSGRMSHFCWASNSTLLGYGGKANSVNTLRRNRALLKLLFKPLLPIYKHWIKDSSALAKSLTGDAYYLFDTDTPGSPKLVAPSMRAEDGHPAMLPGGRHFVTDTYARAALGQLPRLFMVDLTGDTHSVLAEVGSIPELDETPLRCDLHPRISPAGDIVSIDTMDGGQRRTYAYRLERL